MSQERLSPIKWHIFKSAILKKIPIEEIKARASKAEHENSDLRFLNTQYLHKLRAIEKESKDKSKKILELQEKNFQAVIHTPGLKDFYAIF